MKTIQSIDKAVRILDCVAQNNGVLTLTDLSRALDMAVATLHGFLTTLEKQHLLVRDAGGRYALGAKLFQLGLYCAREQTIRTAAHPYLFQMAQEFRESVHLGLEMGDQLIYADRAEPEQPFRETSVAGETVPYYDSAIGLIIRTANRCPIPSEYLENCNDMAREGFCLKWEPGMEAYCLGVPLLQPGVPCSAGFSVVLPRSRFSPDRAQHIAQRVQEITRPLSQ